MFKQALIVPVMLQSVLAATTVTTVFKDADCKDPVGANYFNSLQSSDGLPPFDQCIKPADTSIGSGKVTNQTNPVTLDNFPNLNTKARLASAIWTNGNCSGIPSVVTVYYQDTVKLQAKCNNQTLVAINNNKTETQRAGCQAGNGSSAMFKCLLPDASLPLNNTNPVPPPPIRPVNNNKSGADKSVGIQWVGALLAGSWALMAL